MERQNYMNNLPEKEFYFIYYGDGSFNLVSAIGLKGGYVYYLIESKGNIFDKNFRPRISPISNILDYCGLPNAQVISIDPRDPKTRTLYTKLSGYIDEFNRNDEKVLN
jgi:hypothetical protein